MKTETKITLIYLLFGFLWITLTDNIFFLFNDYAELYSAIHTYKGWFFIIITAVVFYFILHKAMEKVRAQNQALQESYEQLEADHEEFMALNEEIMLKNQELNEGKERLHKIMDLVPHLIFAKDSTGKFLLVNKAVASLYGKTPAELVGKKHVELHDNISPEELEVFLATDQKVLEKNEPVLIEEEYITDINGHTRIYITKKIPFKYSESIEKAILGVAVDITELKKSEQLIRAYHQKEEKFREELILSVSSLLEIHDSYTGDHSRNVAILAKRLAEELSLDQEEIEYAYWTGIVHDIGKILVPLEILNKKGRLDEEEFKIIKKHPEWGYQSLARSELLSDIASYVLYHHERWDGKGYPEGLNGKDIPLVAQIIALADTWDAMCSDRPYRKALDKETAMEEIYRNKGTQFNPALVELFLKIITEFY
ncbi:MAG TPA: HD-GYP domain-containing protein [Halanaerobiales bacterium]|jgi:PAS domain S-box-containing protein|nr:HD-GYP domain-containing protein [Halanaerobiales bacterium]HPZ63586.1 HD-GYP domain-containing protein [Halanaerobiales bacterium]HQD04888.1 HD-GYP domain-containing protein [Halanaerobiales bacterium]